MKFKKGDKIIYTLSSTETVMYEVVDVAPNRPENFYKLKGIAILNSNRKNSSRESKYYDPYHRWFDKSNARLATKAELILYGEYL